MRVKPRDDARVFGLPAARVCALATRGRAPGLGARLRPGTARTRDAVRAARESTRRRAAGGGLPQVGGVDVAVRELLARGDGARAAHVEHAARVDRELAVRRAVVVDRSRGNTPTASVAASSCAFDRRRPISARTRSRHAAASGSAPASRSASSASASSRAATSQRGRCCRTARRAGAAARRSRRTRRPSRRRERVEELVAAVGRRVHRALGEHELAARERARGHAAAPAARVAREPQRARERERARSRRWCGRARASEARAAGSARA